MDVSKNSGTPKSSIFSRVFHYKASILGYPYFWKHPYSDYIISPKIKSPVEPEAFDIFDSERTGKMDYHELKVWVASLPRPVVRKWRVREVKTENVPSWVRNSRYVM